MIAKNAAHFAGAAEVRGCVQTQPLMTRQPRQNSDGSIKGFSLHLVEQHLNTIKALLRVIDLQQFELVLFGKRQQIRQLIAQ